MEQERPAAPFAEAEEDERGASGAGTDFAAIEEIQVVSCYGTDTGVLDAEMRRAIDQMCKK